MWSIVGLIGGAVLLWYLRRRPPANAAEVASLTGWVMFIAILLAPATRVGYLLYPINLFVWAWMLRRSDEPSGARRGAVPVLSRRRPAGAGGRRRSLVVGQLEELDGERGGAGRCGGRHHHAHLPVEAVPAAQLGQDLGALPAAPAEPLPA